MFKRKSRNPLIFSDELGSTLKVARQRSGVGGGGCTLSLMISCRA